MYNFLIALLAFYFLPCPVTDSKATKTLHNQNNLNSNQGNKEPVSSTSSQDKMDNPQNIKDLPQNQISPALQNMIARYLSQSGFCNDKTENWDDFVPGGKSTSLDGISKSSLEALPLSRIKSESSWSYSEISELDSGESINQLKGVIKGQGRNETRGIVEGFPERKNGNSSSSTNAAVSETMESGGKDNENKIKIESVEGYYKAVENGKKLVKSETSQECQMFKIINIAPCEEISTELTGAGRESLIPVDSTQLKGNVHCEDTLHHPVLNHRLVSHWNDTLMHVKSEHDPVTETCDIPHPINVSSESAISYEIGDFQKNDFETFHNDCYAETDYKTRLQIQDRQSHLVTNKGGNSSKFGNGELTIGSGSMDKVNKYIKQIAETFDQREPTAVSEGACLETRNWHQNNAWGIHLDTRSTVDLESPFTEADKFHQSCRTNKIFTSDQAIDAKALLSKLDKSSSMFKTCQENTLVHKPEKGRSNLFLNSDFVVDSSSSSSAAYSGTTETCTSDGAVNDSNFPYLAAETSAAADIRQQRKMQCEPIKTGSSLPLDWSFLEENSSTSSSACTGTDEIDRCMEGVTKITEACSKGFKDVQSSVDRTDKECETVKVTPANVSPDSTIPYCFKADSSITTNFDKYDAFRVGDPSLEESKLDFHQFHEVFNINKEEKTSKDGEVVSDSNEEDVNHCQQALGCDIERKRHCYDTDDKAKTSKESNDIVISPIKSATLTDFSHCFTVNPEDNSNTNENHNDSQFRPEKYMSVPECLEKLEKISENVGPCEDNGKCQGTDAQHSDRTLPGKNETSLHKEENNNSQTLRKNIRFNKARDRFIMSQLDYSTPENTQDPPVKRHSLGVKTKRPRSKVLGQVLEITNELLNVCNTRSALSVDGVMDAIETESEGPLDSSNGGKDDRKYDCSSDMFEELLTIEAEHVEGENKTVICSFSDEMETKSKEKVKKQSSTAPSQGKNVKVNINTGKEASTSSASEVKRNDLGKCDYKQKQVASTPVYNCSEQNVKCQIQGSKHFKADTGFDTVRKKKMDVSKPYDTEKIFTQGFIAEIQSERKTKNLKRKADDVLENQHGKKQSKPENGQIADVIILSSDSEEEVLLESVKKKKVFGAKVVSESNTGKRKTKLYKNKGQNKEKHGESPKHTHGSYVQRQSEQSKASAEHRSGYAGNEDEMLRYKESKPQEGLIIKDHSRTQKPHPVHVTHVKHLEEEKVMANTLTVTSSRKTGKCESDLSQKSEMPSMCKSQTSETDEQKKLEKSSLISSKSPNSHVTKKARLFSPEKSKNVDSDARKPSQSKNNEDHRDLLKKLSSPQKGKKSESVAANKKSKISCSDSMKKKLSSPCESNQVHFDLVKKSDFLSPHKSRNRESNTQNTDRLTPEKSKKDNSQQENKLSPLSPGKNKMLCSEYKKKLVSSFISKKLPPDMVKNVSSPHKSKKPESIEAKKTQMSSTDKSKKDNSGVTTKVGLLSPGKNTISDSEFRKKLPSTLTSPGKSKKSEFSVFSESKCDNSILPKDPGLLSSCTSQKDHSVMADKLSSPCKSKKVDSDKVKRYVLPSWKSMKHSSEARIDHSQPSVSGSKKSMNDSDIKAKIKQHQVEKEDSSESDVNTVCSKICEQKKFRRIRIITDDSDTDAETPPVINLGENKKVFNINQLTTNLLKRQGLYCKVTLKRLDVALHLKRTTITCDETYDHLTEQRVEEKVAASKVTEDPKNTKNVPVLKSKTVHKKKEKHPVSLVKPKIADSGKLQSCSPFEDKGGTEKADITVLTKTIETSEWAHQDVVTRMQETSKSIPHAVVTKAPEKSKSIPQDIAVAVKTQEKSKNINQEIARFESRLVDKHTEKSSTCLGKPNNVVSSDRQSEKDVTESHVKETEKLSLAQGKLKSDETELVQNTGDKTGSSDCVNKMVKTLENMANVISKKLESCSEKEVEKETCKKPVVTKDGQTKTSKDKLVSKESSKSRKSSKSKSVHSSGFSHKKDYSVEMIAKVRAAMQAISEYSSKEATKSEPTVSCVDVSSTSSKSKILLKRIPKLSSAPSKESKNTDVSQTSDNKQCRTKSPDSVSSKKRRDIKPADGGGQSCSKSFHSLLSSQGQKTSTDLLHSDFLSPAYSSPNTPCSSRLVSKDSGVYSIISMSGLSNSSCTTNIKKSHSSKVQGHAKDSKIKHSDGKSSGKTESYKSANRNSANTSDSKSRSHHSSSSSRKHEHSHTSSDHSKREISHSSSSSKDKKNRDRAKLVCKENINSVDNKNQQVTVLKTLRTKFVKYLQARFRSKFQNYSIDGLRHRADTLCGLLYSEGLLLGEEGRTLVQEMEPGDGRDEALEAEEEGELLRHSVVQALHG